MVILTVTDKGKTTITRIVIGCSGPAMKLVKELELRGNTVKISEGDEPDRSAEEKQRAAKMLTEIFGH